MRERWYSPTTCKQSRQPALNAKLAAHLRLQCMQAGSPCFTSQAQCAGLGMEAPAAARTNLRSAAALAGRSELPGPWLLPIARPEQARSQAAGQLLGRPRSSAAGWAAGSHTLGSTGCPEARGQLSAARERGAGWPVAGQPPRVGVAAASVAAGCGAGQACGLLVLVGFAAGSAAAVLCLMQTMTVGAG